MRFRNRLFAGLALLASIGLAASFWLNRHLTPPPASAPGGSPRFDTHLADLDRRFRFVFETNNEVVLGGIDGTVERVLFQIPLSTGWRPSTFWSTELSPTGKYLLIACSSDYKDGSLAHRLFVVAVETGLSEEIVYSREGFTFDIPSNTSLCNWLVDGSFVVSLINYPENAAHKYRQTLLRYTLGDLSSPSEIRVGDPHPFFLSSDRYTWFVYSSGDRFQVLDGDQLRAATADEAAVFERLYLEQHKESKSLGGHEVTVRSRPAAGEGFEPWSQDIYLDGGWVRRTDGDVRNVIRRGFSTIWNESAKLYLWCEYRPHGVSSVTTTFAMENEGRYRALFPGRYVGMIPAN